MTHSYAQLFYHFVFSTRARARFIDEELEARLHAYLGGIVRNIEGTALQIGGIEDHVHILALLRPKTAPADAINAIKTNSSGWVHKSWRERWRFAWQIGYGAFSVSRSNVEEVKAYIANQREHHRTMTFEEEYLELLRKHDVSFDPRYVFD